MIFRHGARRLGAAARSLVVLSLLGSVPFLAQGQRGGGRGGGGGGGGFSFGSALGCWDPPVDNVPYDGRFILVRLIYPGTGNQCYYRPPGTQFYEPSWSHGYAQTTRGTSEANLLNITSAISSLRPRKDGSNAIAIDDPELFKYPVAFVTEFQYAQLTDKQAQALQRYLLKGGFLIVDDTRDDFQHSSAGWPEVVATFQQVFPTLHPIDMPISHPIFHAFFDVPSFNDIPQYYDRQPAAYRGIFVDNDPKKRLMVMIGFNNDLSNYWEYSPMGLKPVDESNLAYKLGVNYIFYSLTH